MDARGVILAAGMLMRAAAPGVAQQSVTPADSTHAEIGTTLRAFYFNLAHQDWEALAADILSAKILASRPAPEALIVAGRRTDGAVEATDCPAGSAAPLDRAIVTLKGGWARVSVPLCDTEQDTADEFRLVRFQGRWRVVYIDLFRRPEAVPLAK